MQLSNEIKGIVIKSTGEVTFVEPYNDTDFSLAQLKGIVMGYIEIVPLHDGLIMILNEEGKLMELPPNWKATDIWQDVVGPVDYIVGNVLITTSGRVK